MIADQRRPPRSVADCLMGTIRLPASITRSAMRAAARRSSRPAAPRPRSTPTGPCAGGYRSSSGAERKLQFVTVVRRLGTPPNMCVVLAAGSERRRRAHHTVQSTFPARPGTHGAWGRTRAGGKARANGTSIWRGGRTGPRWENPAYLAVTRAAAALGYPDQAGSRSRSAALRPPAAA